MYTSHKQKFRRLLMLFIYMLGTVGVIACGGSGHDANNLATTRIAVVGAKTGPSGHVVVQAAHPMRVSLGIYAELDTENVPIDLYLLDKEQFDAEAADIRQYIVGSVVLPFVEAGDRDYLADIVVPFQDYDGNPIDSTGIFYLQAEVDAPNLIFETNEDDNRPQEDNLDETMQIVEVDDAKKMVPNIVLEKVVIDIPTLTLPEQEPDACGNIASPLKPSEIITNVQNSHLGVTAVVYSTGSYWLNGMPVAIPRTEFSARVDIPGVGWRSVQIWDSIASDFTDTFSIPDLEHGIRQSVYLDMRVPPDVATDIKSYVTQTIGSIWTNEKIKKCEDEVGSGETTWYDCLQNVVSYPDFEYTAVDFEISVVGYDEAGNPISEYKPPGFEFSNEIEVKINVLPPARPPADSGPIRFESGYQKGFQGQHFGAGVDLNGWGSIDKTGAHGGASATVPIKLLGNAFNFLGMEMVGHGNPKKPFKSSFMMDLEFANTTVFSKIIDAEHVAGEPDDQVREYLKWDPSGEWKIEKTKKEKKDFMISVVPVTVRAEAGGTLGFDMVAQICVAEDMCEPTPGGDVPEFQAYAGPTASVDADVSAGVGSSRAAFGAGVGGDITLISDTFYATANASVMYDVDASQIVGTLTEDLTNTLTGPKGGVYVYAEYPAVKICRKFGVPYPCGIKQRKKKKYLDKWSSFELKDVLFCDIKEAVVDL